MAQYNNSDAKHNNSTSVSGVAANQQKQDMSKAAPPPPPTAAATAMPNNANSNTSDPNTPAGAGGAGAQHKRVYQACIPCRRRKVRCDLGSVDNPHDPPCVRCRRESKECFFSATRRKRKTEDDDSDVEEYVIRNGRRKMQASSPGRQDRGRGYNESPATPASAVGGSNWRSQPLRRPDGSGRKRANEFEGGDANQTLENLEAQTVMGGQMYGLHDALDLLYKAATDRYVSDSRVIAPCVVLIFPKFQEMLI